MMGANKNVKIVNDWMRSAGREQLDSLMSALVLTARQDAIFKARYLSHDSCSAIAIDNNISEREVHYELCLIREKIIASLLR